MDITPAEFDSRHNANADAFVIIDVRDRLEFQTYNRGGINIPLGDLVNRLDDLDLDKDQEIIMICQRGLRSETGRRILVQNGYQNVKNLAGGLLAVRKLKNHTS